MWAGYLWVIKAGWWLLVAGGAFIPWRSCESARVSVCCWLADPQSGPYSCSHSVPTSAISRQRTSLSLLSVSSWILLPCGIPHLSNLPCSFSSLPFHLIKAPVPLFSFFLLNTEMSHTWWDWQCMKMLARGVFGKLKKQESVVEVYHEV